MRNFGGSLLAIGILLLLFRVANPYLPEVNFGGAGTANWWEPPLELVGAVLLAGAVFWIVGFFWERVKREQAEDKQAK